eukprot:PITA_02726
MAISNSVSGCSTLNFDDVVGAILSEEIRWKSSGETSGNALTAETRGRKMERGKSPGYHMQVETRKKWEKDMKEEMDSLEHNHTWDLVRLPTGKTTLQNKWVYKLKEEHGGRKKYKARLVVKGFAQKKGIDFDEMFSPVVKMTSIRTILSLVAAEDLHLVELRLL